MAQAATLPLNVSLRNATLDYYRVFEQRSAWARENLLISGTRNNAAARVVGRVSLFLENLVPNEELKARKIEHRRLKLKVEELEKKIGADSSNERLISILNNISPHVWEYIRALETEF